MSDMVDHTQISWSAPPQHDPDWRGTVHAAAVVTTLTLAGILHDVRAFLRRYVVLSDEQAMALTLWAAHTHVIEAADCTPYVQVTSATARAGKTRLLEACEPLVARGWLTGRTSAAALVRKVDKDSPTLLLDESDAAFGGEREYAEALRGVLNSGYRRSGCTTLCVGQGANLTFRDFRTFGAKAIAGIGDLPPTIADRAIPIELKRRAKKEHVERFRERDARIQAEPIHTALVAWAMHATDVLRASRPSLPAALNDRAQDVWEPLLSIADLAGDSWPERARQAAVVLMGERNDEDVTVELLHDIRAAFEDASASFMASGELVTKLCAMDDRPWNTWSKGKPMTGHRVARLLKPFGIVPVQNTARTARGYYRDRFEDAWSRYPASKVSECPEPNQSGPELAFSKCLPTSEMDTSKTQETPINPALSDTRTLQTGGQEGQDDAGNF